MFPTNTGKTKQEPDRCSAASYCFAADEPTMFQHFCLLDLPRHWICFVIPGTTNNSTVSSPKKGPRFTLSFPYPETHSPQIRILGRCRVLLCQSFWEAQLGRKSGNTLGEPQKIELSLQTFRHPNFRQRLPT